MTLAVLPATFDPITCGHVDLAARAARAFDHLIMAVFEHPKKKVLFSVEERLEMARESVAALERVEVMSFNGLVVDFCRKVGATVLVRGLRTASDFDYEQQQAILNRAMNTSVDTFCLFSSAEYSALSSSMIKEIAEQGGDVRWMVPEPVARRLSDRFRPGTAPLVSGG